MGESQKQELKKNQVKYMWGWILKKRGVKYGIWRNSISEGGDAVL